MLRAAVGLASAFSVIGSLSTATSAHLTPACRPEHSRTVRENHQLRVYSVSARDGQGRRVWACLLRSGTRTSLGYHSFDYHYEEDVEPIRLNGAIVGWRHWVHDREGWSYRLRVRNMRTGELLHSHDSDIGRDACRDCYSWEASPFVMDRAGSLAWIADGSGEPGVMVRLVYKADLTRRGQVIDRGSSIDPGSLRRDARTISWRHGEGTRTAQFVR
jgi:hypothetical protein